MCSVQGYGPKAPGYPAFVYPGSGATCDTAQLAAAKVAEAAAAAAAAAREEQNGGGALAGSVQVAPGSDAMDVDRQPGIAPAGGTAAAAVKAEEGAPSAAAAGAGAGQQQEQQGQRQGQDDGIEEDPDQEFGYKGAHEVLNTLLGSGG